MRPQLDLGVHLRCPAARPRPIIESAARDFPHSPHNPGLHASCCARHGSRRPTRTEHVFWKNALQIQATMGASQQAGKSQCPRRCSQPPPGYLASTRNRRAPRLPPSSRTLRAGTSRRTLSEYGPRSSFVVCKRVFNCARARWTSFIKILKNLFPFLAEGLTLHNVLALWVRCHRHVRISIRVRMGVQFSGM